MFVQSHSSAESCQPKASSPENTETEAWTLFQFVWEAGEVRLWPPQLPVLTIAQGLAHLNELVFGILFIILQFAYRCSLTWGRKKLLFVRNVGCRVLFWAWLLLNLTLATFVYPLNSRLCTISLSWAAGCDWDYSCMHVQSQFLPGLCVVGGLLNSADDKVACQTREKANTSDSGSIYILLCNLLDLFRTICLLTAEMNH